MSTPSIQSQVDAVRLAAKHVGAIAKATGLRNATQTQLLRDLLEAAAATLATRPEEARDGRL